jgi:ABC-type Fe3+ transport system permease subunit
VLYELQTYSNQQAAAVLSVLILIVVLAGNLLVARVTKGKIGI